MKNNITERGLDLIANHLVTRIKGLSFKKEVELYESYLSPNYTMFQIQTLAERMAAYMVMIGYTPVIQLEDLPENVAGQINLNDSKYVYIKIDKSRFESREYTPIELVAVIAHELSHKFLWIHGFKDTSAKIEYMTDACAIFLGFGEFLYQASDMVTAHYDTDGTIKRCCRKLGYLEKWQIAYLRNKFFGLDLPCVKVCNTHADEDENESNRGVSWNTIALIIAIALLIFFFFFFA